MDTTSTPYAPAQVIPVAQHRSKQGLFPVLKPTLLHNPLRYACNSVRYPISHSSSLPMAVPQAVNRGDRRHLEKLGDSFLRPSSLMVLKLYYLAPNSGFTSKALSERVGPGKESNRWR